MDNPFRATEYLTSITQMKQAPADTGAEVAFAGRSNVGKSSVLNALTNRKDLARTSKTPGRTQMINFFLFREELRLVDLPGYGFAKVPEAVKQKWARLLEAYFQQRQSLKGLVHIMDIRHPLKPLDEQMLGWLEETGLPVVVLLNKADKLKRGPAMNVLAEVKRHIKKHFHLETTVLLCSAQKGQGIEELRKQLLLWFE